jgi:hypothetical protein
MDFSQPTKWCDWLPTAEWWYNSSYHTAIKMTPFEALYEYSPPQLSADVNLADCSTETTAKLLAKDSMIKQLQSNLAQAQKSMQKHADKNRNPRTFEVGEMVYLKMQPHRKRALGRKHARKLSSKWYGPFLITQAIGKRAYKLQLPTDSKIHDVFHINQLKKHLGPLAVPNPTLPLVTPTSKVKYFPFAILQRRQIPRTAGDYDAAVPQWLI